MRKIWIYMMTVLSVSAMVAGCCEFAEGEDPLIIEPDDIPMFQFGDDGIPYRWNSPALSSAMQRDLKKEFVGYGWKWMQTHEIEEYGFVCPENYYGEIIGPSPQSYYIASDTELVTFFHSDAVNDDICSYSVYQMNPKTGLMTAGMLSAYGYPWSIYMRVWSIYMLSGKWYMSCVEPLCTRTTDSKELKVVWGTSQYVRMTDAELREMLKKHSYKQE